MEIVHLPKEAIPEVSKYFVECWGNRKRIDYGTGHEASFLAWLYCFDKQGLIKAEDYKAVVIKVFFKYGIALVHGHRIHVHDGFALYSIA